MFLRLLVLATLTQVLQGQVTVRIEPRNPVLRAGGTVAFQAQVANTPRKGCLWTVRGEGAIGPDGVFLGIPDSRCTVRATSVDDPTAWDETPVSVLPGHPGLGVVADVLGPEVFDPGWSMALPFRDLTGSARFGDPEAQVHTLVGSGYAEHQVVGYGLKVPVQWPCLGLGADALLLSYLESGEPVRRDVTGQSCAMIQARGTVAGARVEALNASGGKAWMSRVQNLRIKVRGLVPLAGNPATGPGDADGPWLAARFRRPEGLAVLPDGTLLAADAEAHVLRRIDPDRNVTTFLGVAGEPGDQDGGPGVARFRAPTFLAVAPLQHYRRLEASPARFVVADTGNHTLRAVDALGQVSTLAGVSGRPGYQDAVDGPGALFNEPRGLAMDPAGNVYVADRGNHVIRRISPRGAVTTVAGRPRSAGSEDGGRDTARFQDLKGLALGRSHPLTHAWTLYVVDGHSVRRVTTEGAVTTLCGHPAQAGPVRPGWATPGAPCLDQPQGIACYGRHLLVADPGNHAIQILELAEDGRIRLGALAGGDRNLAETRFGLLKFGLPGPLGAAFGSVGSPRGVAVDAAGEVYVADGSCLVHVSEPLAPGNLVPPKLALHPGGAVAAGLALVVDFTLPRLAAGDGEIDDLDQPQHWFWSLECLDPRTGAALVKTASGEARGRKGGCARVLFEEKGEVEVHLTCIRADGFPMRDSVRIVVD